MAYNRWLSGSQYYQPSDVLHYGRKGMKWGKHIFGIDPNLLRNLNFGSKFNSESLQSLLQRGQIDFATFKKMINQQNVANQMTWEINSPSTARPAKSLSINAARRAVNRSGEATKSVVDSVAKKTKDRKEQEDKYRRIAEDKAKMTKESEEQAAKKAKERSKSNAKNKAVLDEDKKAGPASKNGSATRSKSDVIKKGEKASTTKVDTKPAAQTSGKTSSDDANEKYTQLILGYLNETKNKKEEERQKEWENERSLMAAQRDKEIKDEREKRLRSILKIVQYLNKVLRHF